MDPWPLNAFAPEQWGYFVAAPSPARVLNALAIVLVGVMVSMLAKAREIDPSHETRKVVPCGNRMLLLFYIMVFRPCLSACRVC